MQLQKGLVQLPGVLDAGAVMATPANCALLDDLDLLPDQEIKARPEDLLIVVRAGDERSATEALGAVDSLLAKRPSATHTGYRPRSIESALKQVPEASWVLISVPGRYAGSVAEKSLSLGLNVFLYSDNVPIADEIRLKQIAKGNGLLLLGPDCGTTILNGIGFGFANHVRRGRIGIVGASGTGIQAVSVAVHNLGEGISQALGTGGRDLHQEVGAITALRCIELLAVDPATEVLVFISKPPDPAVATGIISRLLQVQKPVVVHFLGYPAAFERQRNLYFAHNLTDAASIAVDLVNRSASALDSRDIQAQSPKPTGYLRGLFSGGTLAYEAMLWFQAELLPLYSNVPLVEAQRFDKERDQTGHIILDLGADEFTAGRLHPMIDQEFRIRRFRQEIEDPRVSVVLLDVILGEGAHPDPASELSPEISDACLRSDLEVVVLLVGTDEDPQNLSGQKTQFEIAGARVFTATIDAFTYISERMRKPSLEPHNAPQEIFDMPVIAVNVGLESFYDSLLQQGAEAVHVDWKPPAGGNERLIELLERVR
jgi:FdrA protein